jgi:deoxyadenosine/deoxycytidine kinase
MLAQHEPSVQIIHEPLQDWEDSIASKSLLSNFYEDPYRWAFTMESNTLLSRSQEYMLIQKSDTITFMERSLFSGYYCFAYNSYQSGFLTNLEWHLYRTLFHEFVAQTCKPPTGFIYLRVDPEVAFERIKKRDRTAEKTITLDYIKQIHDRHEAFLVDKIDIMQQLVNTPVLIIDCNQEFETNDSHYAQHVKAVKQFIQSNNQNN